MSYDIHRLPRRLTPEEEEMDIYDIIEQGEKKTRGKKAAQDGDEFDDELDDELDGCEPADEPDEDKAADEPEYKPVRLCQDGDTLWLKIDEDFNKMSQFHFNCVAWPKLLMLAVNYGWELNRPGLTESKILQEKEIMKNQIRYSHIGKGTGGSYGI